MPKEAAPKPNRWEGTHTYKKPEAEKRRARTVAQLREESAAKSKASRDEAFNKRRGSICPPVSSIPRARRGSIGGISVDRSTSGREDQDREEPVGDPGEQRDDSTDNQGNQNRSNSTGNEDDRRRDPEEEGQEEMPGSSSKNRKQSGGRGEAEGVDPALRDFLNAMKQDIVQSTKDTVGQIEARLEKHENSISALERKVEESEKNIEKKIAAEVSKQCGPVLAATAMARNTAIVAATGKSSSKRDEAYQWCRRSLKRWPVEGEDLEDAVRMFIKNRLKCSNERIERLGSIAVAHPTTRMAREKKEVIATFECREDRDFLKAQGNNLAGQNEVGMSIHVPGHLLDNLAALNGLAYAIKLKNKGLKRAVKFDDAVQDIYLDLCISGNWRRVSPAQAKLALKDTPVTGASSGALDASVLSDLIKGVDVPGVTVAVVQEDEMDE